MHLVVSTLLQSVIYSFIHNKVVKIGQKDRKSPGNFGAVIIDGGNMEDGIVLAARPGQRLWKSNISGVIQETMIFKSALSQEHPQVQYLTESINQINLANVQFGQLAVYDDSYILIWSDSAVLLIDPEQKSVVSSYQKTNIADVATFKDEIFVLVGLRHIIRIAPSPEIYSYEKGAEESSLIEDILEPFKDLGLVKERGDTFSATTENSSSLFNWLRKKRSVSTPAALTPEKKAEVNSIKLPREETLPDVVKLESSDCIPIKLDEHFISAEDSENADYDNNSKENDFDEIVFRPKKKKKAKKVRFQKALVDKHSKNSSDTNTELKTSLKTDEQLDNNAEKKKTQIAIDVPDSLDLEINDDVAINEMGSTDLKQSLDLKVNHSDHNDNNVSRSDTDNTELQNTASLYSDKPSETQYDASQRNNIFNTELENIPLSNSNVKLSDSQIEKDVNLNLCVSDSLLSENDKTSSSLLSKINDNANYSDLSNQQTHSTDINSRDASCENCNVLDEIYQSLDNEMYVSKQSNLPCSASQSDIKSAEEPETLSELEFDKELPKYGVDWVQYKAPELLLDLCTSDEHIFCVDIRNQMYFSKYPVLGLHWMELSQPAEKIAVSPSETVVWALYKGTIYAAVHKSVLPWVETEWLSVARDIVSIAVDDDCGWYVSSNGHLIRQNNLTPSQPFGYPEVVPIKVSALQVAVRKGVVWILTISRSLFCKKYSKGKLTSQWKEIQLQDIPPVDSIYLGNQQTGWIVDQNNAIYFMIGVTPESPEGIGKPWEVEASNYLFQPPAQLPAAVLKALNNEMLTSFIRGKQHLCLSASVSGVWFCKSFDNLLYSNQKNVIGHLWDQFVPPSTASATKWTLISVRGSFQYRDSLWFVNKADELFCLCNSNSLVAVELPSIAGIRMLEPCSQSLWLLSQCGAIYVRRGITLTCLQGGWWQALDLTQLGSTSITHISCAPHVSWACTEEGSVLLRIGSLSPSARSKLPQAWIPVSSDVEESSSSFVEKVYVGPLGYPVWVIDSKHNVYVREGVENNLPIGKKWILVPELPAQELCISKHAVWLLCSSGKIYRRFGISEKNPCGDYWKQIPGNMNYISGKVQDNL
ncbi:tectonin beta-propeller repeat-containing protein 2-like [Stegodyphus dumicola]|uniref:tectonin beta-propeller repeat-containing protein 2-like n=1 Tax=Stegodyphus dumicola TaxID=202533 RepID=UPI0015B164DB|nr:tectonin beta-propeller repeat-containing protein 2-like [Stegodyphus dumicola]